MIRDNQFLFLIEDDDDGYCATSVDGGQGERLRPCPRLKKTAFDHSLECRHNMDDDDVDDDDDDYDDYDDDGDDHHDIICF